MYSSFNVEYPDTTDAARMLASVYQYLQPKNSNQLMDVTIHEILLSRLCELLKEDSYLLRLAASHFLRND